MGNLTFVDNMIENKLMSLHTTYLGKVLGINGDTAKVQPLTSVKGYGAESEESSVLSSVPIANSARYKITAKEINHVTDVKLTTSKSDGYVSSASISTTKDNEVIATLTPLSVGDIVVCVCCERNITEAKKGRATTAVIGRHSMSDSIIVGIL